MGAVAAAACSSWSPGSAAESPGSASAAASVTISTNSVPGVGTALVNGQGQTLYLLTSEQGGKITCTDDNGCTKVWPDTELPAGTTQGIAGSGVQASMLGTTKSATGDLYLTYGGFPLYTFSGDSAAGQDNGEGIMSFGGTWTVMSPAGNPVTAGSSSASSSGYTYNN